MRTRKVAEAEVLALSTRDESHFFDRKAFGVKGRKVQKIAVALANADGGEFLIGVSDDKDEPETEKRWHGAPRIEDLNGALQALFELSPTPDILYDPDRASKKTENLVVLDKSS
jgi:ATP-dependent DNA helicase RecG